MEDKNKNVNRINKEIKKTKTYGKPIGSKGVLRQDNTYAEEKKSPKVKAKPVRVQEASSDSAVKEEINKTTAVTVKEEGLPVENKAPKKNVVSSFVNMFKVEERSRVYSVETTAPKRRVPIFTILTVALVSILLMFIVIDYVQIFENQTVINEMKKELEASRKDEDNYKLMLEDKLTDGSLRDFALENGMKENDGQQQKDYIDISEEEVSNGYKPVEKDYGAIATIMNALGESAKALIEAFGN